MGRTPNSLAEICQSNPRSLLQLCFVFQPFIYWSFHLYRLLTSWKRGLGLDPPVYLQQCQAQLCTYQTDIPISINFFFMICPDRELFLIIILITSQAKKTNETTLRSPREFIKILFLATLFLTSQYHLLPGIYACDQASRSIPRKGKYLVDIG